MTRLAFTLAAATMLISTAAAHAAPQAASHQAAPAPTAAQASPGKSAPATTAAGTPESASGAVPACPGDRPVWVNPRSKAYHLQGDRSFGHTKRGHYACETAAKSAGDHLAKGK